MNQAPTPGSNRKNKRLTILLALIVISMVGLAYASVPLYRLFCQVTGYGGTTQRVATAPAETKNRTITVGFDAAVNDALPWDFVPEMKEMTVKLGEVAVVNYKAHNNSNKPLVGTATHNVQPDKAGIYFNKIQCFCFNQQLLAPGETRELPVQFFIDPALADDPKNDDVRHITLSYTFFMDKDQSLARTKNKISP